MNASPFITGGLSPLARGTPQSVLFFYYSQRFIPAGAGNTFLVAFFLLYIAVYPRWRGEHLDVAENKLAEAGLSPLARGTHFKKLRIRHAGRFIPAGAGNT